MTGRHLTYLKGATTLKPLPIAGFQKVSLVDFPSHIAAIVFTQGCNMRCFYCHNADLVPGPKEDDEEYSCRCEGALDYLSKRTGRLEGVCITGGEPTLHKERLTGFVRQVKAFGYKVKLDTNGTSPEYLSEALDQRLFDYIAMDVKAPVEEYFRLGYAGDGRRIEESIRLIKSSNCDYEFRLTCVPGFTTIDHIKNVGRLLSKAKLIALQNFVYNPHILSPGLCAKARFEPAMLEEYKRVMERESGAEVIIRNV